MIFKSGWSRTEIESLTYRDLFKYVGLYYKIYTTDMFEFFKAFCIYNAESSAVAFSAKQGTLSKYSSEVQRRKIDTSNDSSVEDEFKGVNFGQ